MCCTILTQKIKKTVLSLRFGVLDVRYFERDEHIN